MRPLPPAFRTIPSGVELVGALAEAFAKHRGWVQAVGFVEDAELRLGSEAADVRRTFRGRFALAQLAGPLGGPYGATLSRVDGERVEVTAGVLLAARSGGVSALCVSSGDELPAGRAGATAPAQTMGAPGTIAPRKPPSSSFAARVGVSRPNDDDDEPEQELPVHGDLVDHFAFGLCEVLSAAGARFVLRDLRGPGRIREVVADRLSVTGPSEHDGKRLFRMTKKT